MSSPFDWNNGCPSIFAPKDGRHGATLTRVRDQLLKDAQGVDPQPFNQIPPTSHRHRTKPPGFMKVTK